MDKEFNIKNITPRKVGTVTDARAIFKEEEMFTIKETAQLMKLYADACVGKKLIDMGYKKHVTGDPEGDLAELVMLPWFRENEE